MSDDQFEVSRRGLSLEHDRLSAPEEYEISPVLDHGYLGLVEGWGADERIIEAARMSTGGGFNGWEADRRLLEYLYTDRHSTPFEMAGAVFEIRAPIMVFREWHRHRTQSYNEMSARYIPLPDDNYVPSAANVLVRAEAARASRNKQARAATDAVLDSEGCKRWLAALSLAYESGQQAYTLGLSLGVPKELARLSVAVGRYSVMRASANLRNWLAFMTLRSDPKAQEEIRVYAREVGVRLGLMFPRTFALFSKTGRGP